MDTNRASWNVSLKADDRIMRTFSVVGRRFSVDESRSRVCPGERETAAHERGNSLRIQVLGRSIINCKLRRAMSCRSTLQHQKTVSFPPFSVFSPVLLGNRSKVPERAFLNRVLCFVVRVDAILLSSIAADYQFLIRCLLK